MKNLVTRYYFHYYRIIEGCIEKTGRLNMLEWFLLTNYSVPLTSVITIATLVLTTVIVFRLFSKRQVNDFGNKFVVITGCDTGFGHEKAILLDKMGVHVLATCLTKEGQQNLKSETSDRLKTFQMDVTNSQQIKDIYEKVKGILPLGQGGCKRL